MRGLSIYLGLALAACLSCFSISAFAEPIASAYHAYIAVGDSQGVALTRMELTLVQWRTQSQSGDESLKSNLRVSSNHFVMTTAKPLADSYGLAPC
jgi:hypothetical protein